MRVMVPAGATGPAGRHRRTADMKRKGAVVAESVRVVELYPIAPGESTPTGKRSEYRAQLTGEYRQPLKGEWYLSGAEACRAEWDVAAVRHIARLMRAEIRWVPVEEGR